MHNEPSFPPIIATEPVESSASDLLPLVSADEGSEKFSDCKSSAVAQPSGTGRFLRVLESLLVVSLTISPRTAYVLTSVV